MTPSPSTSINQRSKDIGIQQPMAMAGMIWDCHSHRGFVNFRTGAQLKTAIEEGGAAASKYWQPLVQRIRKNLVGVDHDLACQVTCFFVTPKGQ